MKKLIVAIHATSLLLGAMSTTMAEDTGRLDETRAEYRMSGERGEAHPGPTPATGQAASSPAIRLPLRTISVSSGFGLRLDPILRRHPLGSSGVTVPIDRAGHAVVPSRLPRQAVNVATGRGRLLGLSQHNPTQQVLLRSARSMVMHSGVDFVAPSGTPVYAAADGVIVGAAVNGSYGNWVRIEHAGKLATVYGHLLAFAPGIEPGETVAQGAVIGFVGNTGRSTGAHLHFELHVDGTPVDPVGHPLLKTVHLDRAELAHVRK